MSPRQIWALYLTGDCNLACAYCYYRPSSPQGAMTAATAIRAVDFAAAHAAREGAPSVDIGFFGREPLTRFDLIEAIAAHAAAHVPTATFSLNTNGTLLTRERLDFFRGLGARIALSLDGQPYYHDLVRPALDGSSSYGRVAPIIPDLAAYVPAVYVRMTVTAAGARHFHDNAVHLFDLGFSKVGFSFDLTDPHWDDPALASLARSMTQFSDWYAAEVGRGRDIRVPAFDSLARGRRVPAQGLFCGAAGHLFAVDCDGLVYPCWRFVGSKASAMGDVLTGWTTPPDAHPFNTLSQAGIAGCGGCAHAAYCGRCAWVSIRNEGAPDRVGPGQCATARIAIEAGIRACDALAAAGSPLFVGRQGGMDAEEARDGSLVLADETGCLYQIPPEELQKYLVK